MFEGGDLIKAAAHVEHARLPEVGRTVSRWLPGTTGAEVVFGVKVMLFRSGPLVLGTISGVMCCPEWPYNLSCKLQTSVLYRYQMVSVRVICNLTCILWATIGSAVQVSTKQTFFQLQAELTIQIMCPSIRHYVQLFSSLHSGLYKSFSGNVPLY